MYLRKVLRGVEVYRAVPGSNPGIPTMKKTSEFLRSFFFI